MQEHSQNQPKNQIMWDLAFESMVLTSEFRGTINFFNLSSSGSLLESLRAQTLHSDPKGLLLAAVPSNYSILELR